ncbi:MAG: hypothetical protein OQK75_13045 [Gammaproteobacteria bacterium]|nr:hypothetical protein [Gammaproteobacteria bacterium]MCW8988585.1 hypothetical protein [Gammaproteobacteria bacterium]MCW9031875.1 hypothetical protein [Gammaproteobacteria bacterium]
MAYTLEWETKGVYWEYSGTISGKEIIEASTKIYGDPRFDSLRYKLVDFSAAEEVLISEDEIKLITFQHAAASKSNARIKNAIVLTKDDERGKLYAGYLVKSSPWEVRIFDHLEEANNWVGRLI